MYWKDEGYLLSKTNYSENSIIIEAFTLKHGKCSGIVYGGNSRKQKKNYQIGNKISLNWKSKGENKVGYFNIELINPILPIYFDNKKKSSSIISAISILKILLPESQTNEKIYHIFEDFLKELKNNNWICSYILWELTLIKELGFETNFLNLNNPVKQISESIQINNKSFKIPALLQNKNKVKFSDHEIREALIFNRNLLMENFINPNKLRFPVYRNLLEKYYNT
tara:strand:- start:1667 stop:2341 length:675 start_codon:yes stop_codon:yes gene_type:complete